MNNIKNRNINKRNNNKTCENLVIVKVQTKDLV